MRAVMVSDAHLTGVGDPNQEDMVRWLSELSVDRLYILGDLFHHWWGYRGAVMTPYVPVCAALMRLVSEGVSLHVVPGNHDFALGPFFSETLGATVSGPTTVELDGCRYLLAHGDEADMRLSYRLTRRVLRGRVFAGVMNVLGPSRGLRVLSGLAGASRDHMSSPDALVALQQSWARAMMSQTNAHVSVLGHSHWLEEVRCDEGLIVHIGGWLGHRTFLLVEDGVPSLRRWVGGGPLGEVVSAP